MVPKAGWKTTEFWMSLAAYGLTFLVLLGVVSPSDKSTLEGAIGDTVKSAASIVTSGAILWKYIQSRLAVKTGAESVTDK